jgi:hypothetical protein
MTLKDFLEVNPKARHEVLEKRNGKVVVEVIFPVIKKLLLRDRQYLKNDYEKERIAEHSGWQSLKLIFEK